MQRALHSLDVPTRDDIDALSKQVQELATVANRLSAHLEETPSDKSDTKTETQSDIKAKPKRKPKRAQT